jgi:hypothetical protein
MGYGGTILIPQSPHRDTTTTTTTTTTTNNNNNNNNNNIEAEQ